MNRRQLPGTVSLRYDRFNPPPRRTVSKSTSCHRRDSTFQLQPLFTVCLNWHHSRPQPDTADHNPPQPTTTGGWLEEDAVLYSHVFVVDTLCTTTEGSQTTEGRQPSCDRYQPVMTGTVGGPGGRELDWL
ncbi:hypothetical protein Bbelb_304540 [Branchiostoma belcheri]|nr:hypothetical protein Bbelb_304540 [Branchiostoma belcheri]